MSEVFWRDNAYGENEPDRVILCVDLKAEKGSGVVWHKTFKMDAWGDHRGTAMARLVSNPVYFAVEAIANKQIDFGVNAAASDPVIVDKWLKNIKELAQEFDVIDHLS
jgi:saccharopine dehydrogenase (NADP+, L-glutamate forming)